MKIRLLFCLIVISLFFSRCEKPKDSITVMWPWIIYGQATDREGNKYRTLEIANRTWMVDNLKSTMLNDGTAIPVVSDAALWNTLSTPGCCWQNNDPIRRVTYGILYNWYAVNTGKLCPVGWHIPSDAEWNGLTDYLGGENVAGAKLKETGFKHWKSPNTGATNETAFWAYPGGQRSTGSEAIFQYLGESGSWWTSSTHEEAAAISRTMYYNSTNVQKYFLPEKDGLSVRCILN
jgi:uncharacterized protein (TIGR02145 family)